MGNSNSSATRPILFRSHSQEGLDPQVIQAAMDRAARNNPDIYKPLSNSQRKGSNRHVHLRGGDVSYPEEYEGNEPMDESWQQQPLEPTIAPHILGMDDSAPQSTSYSGRRDSVRLAEASSRRQSRRISSHEDLAKSASNNRNPHDVLRELEGLADEDPDDADDYLHALKDMPPSE